MGPIHYISYALSRKDSVCPVPLSLAVTNGIPCLVSFPAGTKMLQFPAFAYLVVFLAMSHSDIPGSRAACASPGLFAACHVLHRF